jgi:hypothetical protein
MQTVGARGSVSWLPDRPIPRPFPEAPRAPSGYIAGFVPGHSCGAATDLHRLPGRLSPTMSRKPFLFGCGLDLSTRRASGSRPETARIRAFSFACARITRMAVYGTQGRRPASLRAWAPPRSPASEVCGAARLFRISRAGKAVKASKYGVVSSVCSFIARGGSGMSVECSECGIECGAEVGCYRCEDCGREFCPDCASETPDGPPRDCPVCGGFLLPRDVS